MSKLIEALKLSEQAPDKKNEYQMTQEQLANIYFGGTDPLAKASKTQPLIIKVVEKPGLYKAIPWLLTSIAIVVMAFSLYSNKKILIDVKVADVQSDWSSPSQSLPSKKVSFTDAVTLPLDSVSFEGAAKMNSSSEGGRLSLNNTSIASFAQAVIIPTHTLNLESHKIVFQVKGARGGEQLAVGVKDSQHIQAYEKGRFFPFPGGVTTQWRAAELSLANAAEGFDRSRVSMIRFDFGSNISNKNGDTIFVKDLKLVPIEK